MAPSTTDHASELSLCVHDCAVLTAAGYVQRQLNLEQLQAGLRCARCFKKKSQLESARIRRQKQKQKAKSKDEAQSQASGGNAEAVSKLLDGLSLSALGDRAAQGVCHSHPGVWIRGGPTRGWSCCGGQFNSDHCLHEPEHTFPEIDVGVLEATFQFWPTPHPAKPKLKRKAVAIDCEMGQPVSGDSELIRLSLIDANSREVLIDSLVSPIVPMQHYRTSITGITKSAMQRAAQRGTCIYGRNNARKRVWDYVGPDTIVIGHGTQNDMNVLHWIHPRIVDTFILANALNKAHLASNESGEAQTEIAEAEKTPLFPSKSLKNLTLQLLHREIQKKSNGHDSVEDAVATLDIATVLCPMYNQMIAAQHV